MKEEGKKALADLDEKMRLRSKAVEELERKEKELVGNESKLQALAHQVEEENRKKSELETSLERSQADFRAVLERSMDKEEVIAEFRSSDANLAGQEKVYFFTIEELIETVVEKHPNWDVQFLKDELDELKKNSKFNHLFSREKDQHGGQD
ncbi:hypothetical protein Adt_38957 [Abeliophyllum distichum]|uniref:Uncharacterized protein n=1 Tax=Abeliophyllum distichum TaxID=126358 RepID=A0ABD1Q3U7_9LAMI